MLNIRNSFKSKNISRFCYLIGLYCISGSIYAKSGSLFSIAEDCRIQNSYTVTLCLNGEGPMTCENYTAHASHLRIKTIVPNHSYSLAGIKVLTPLYTPTNCTQFKNGYCLFSANNITPITIIMQLPPGLLGVC